MMRNNRETVNVSEERRIWLQTGRKRRVYITVCQWSILFIIIILWEFLAVVGVIDSFLVSCPSRIVKTLLNTAENGLMTHIGVTVYETLVGFGLGVVFGVITAILLWWNEYVAKIAEPYLVVLNSLPKIALGPIIILIAGAGTRAIIFMALAISLIVTILEMLSGFNSCDSEHIKMAKTFGATRRQIFIKVVFPSTLPTLFNSLKINIGLSLVGVIAGEFLVSRAGLGYLIVYGGQVFKMDLVMASVIILALVAGVMYKGIALIRKPIDKRFGP